MRRRVGERLRKLAREVPEAWIAVRAVVRERSLAKRWLLGARRAQIALGLTLVLGLFVVPPLRDAAVDAVFPARQVRGGFLGLSRGTRQHPMAGPARSVITGLFWVGGLGATATFLLLHAPEVAGRHGRREGAADAGAEGRAGAGAGPGPLGSQHTMLSGPRAEVASAQTVAATPPAEPGSSGAGPSASAAGSPEGASPAPSAPSQATAERYRVEQELGRGGMGVVYRAQDTVLQRPVALKELPSSLVRNPQLAERFRIEARVLARLTHAGMVQVFDLVENESGMWIAMELVEGGSLDALLEARLPPLDETLRLGAQMAEALAHAHAQGVVHRDFKPHNVLLTPDGRPKIMDFGLAKIAREGPKLTQVGAIMGSPAYMSPEQASGGEADHRADAYAFGVTLYQMAVGRCPFDGDTASILAAHITQPPPDPRELGADLPEELVDLLGSLLAKQPAGRPDDLGQVAAALERIRARG